MIIIAEQEKNWIITDGERFIYQNYKGRYVYANGESMAEQFTKAQAENILKHSLPKNLRNTFHVERVRDKNAVLKPITTEDFHNGFEKVMDKDYTQEWLQKLESLNGMMDEAKERKSLLLDNLSIEPDRVVTAKEYREALRYLYYRVTSATVNEILNIPLTSDWSIPEIINEYTPAYVVDAVEEYKKEYEVYRYEIFENDNTDEDWLVTYVNYNTVYLINREGKTASMGKDILLKEYKRTGETRYLQDFVM